MSIAFFPCLIWGKVLYAVQLCGCGVSQIQSAACHVQNVWTVLFLLIDNLQKVFVYLHSIVLFVKLWSCRLLKCRNRRKTFGDVSGSCIFQELVGLCVGNFDDLQHSAMEAF